MHADQSAFVDFSSSIKGSGLLWSRSHSCCGCKRSGGLRCWSRDIAGTQRHPTMQNFQQNSYNINAGYYINLLTVAYNLRDVFRVGKSAVCNTKAIRRPPLLAECVAIIDSLRSRRFCLFYLPFLNVVYDRVLVGNHFLVTDTHFRVLWCF